MSQPTSQVRGISLRRLFPRARFHGADDIVVRGCCARAECVRPGDLFVALAAPTNGFDAIREARRRGAVALLADRSYPNLGLATCCVADVRQAYARLCQALAGNPGRRLKTIAVAGTHGKTTTSWLAASVLEAGGHAAGVLGALGCWDGKDVTPSRWSTPAAPMLADCLARTAANGCTHAVMEISSRGLSQARSAGIDFDVACLTNVRSRPGRRRGDGCRMARARLLAQLQPEGFAIVNADDPLAAACLEQCDGPVLSIGLGSAAEVSASIIEQLPSEQTFLLHVGGDSAAVRTRLIGTPNIYNALAAAAVGLVYGLDMAAIVRGLEAVECVPGRLERLECGQPYSVFVDHACTPGALAGCLATLRAVTRGRLICLFGARGQRDRSSRQALAHAVESAVDLAVVTSNNPGSESPRQIAAQVVAGFKRPKAARVILDRGEAIAWTLAQARPGDCVLLAGKGHRRYQLLGHERMEFDDRRVARCWLYESPTIDGMYRASA